MADGSLLLKHIAVVLLAAGRSRRFGSNKLDALLDNNQSVLASSMRSYLTLERVCRPRYYLVTNSPLNGPPDACDLARETPRWESIAVNTESPGIGISIAHAVREITKAEAPDGYLIGLADMPFIGPKTIERLIQSFQSSEIVRPQVLNANGRYVQGHPVLFPQRFQRDLAVIDGDIGARTVLKKHADKLTIITVEDKGILKDIDTPDDLIKYQQGGFK